MTLNGKGGLEIHTDKLTRHFALKPMYIGNRLVWLRNYYKIKHLEFMCVDGRETLVESCSLFSNKEEAEELLNQLS